MYSFIDFVLFLNFYKKFISVQVKKNLHEEFCLTDYSLKNMVDCYVFVFKNYSVNCTKLIPVFLGMVDSPVAQ